MEATSTAEIGSVMVHTTSGRGFTPEEIAERALAKILYIGQNAHPAIAAQAEAFRDDIRHVLVHYLREAARSHGTTIANRLVDAGHPELVTGVI
jgi:hypothetical protein